MKNDKDDEDLYKTGKSKNRMERTGVKDSD